MENRYDLGKLVQPSRAEIIDTDPSSSKRLHIQDLSSGLIYLIDTGFDISLISAEASTLKLSPSHLVLFVANDSRV